MSKAVIKECLLQVIAGCICNIARRFRNRRRTRVTNPIVWELDNVVAQAPRGPQNCALKPRDDHVQNAPQCAIPTSLASEIVT